MTWSLLQQTVETAPFSWGTFLGTSGPLAAAVGLLGFLFKVWIDSRKENREDKKADLEGEVGAVAAAREAVKLVREQMAELRQEVAVLEARREEDAKKIEKLEQTVRELVSENEYLKRQRGASDRSG